MTVRLLPQPKELMLVKGMFVVDSETLILIPAQAGDGAHLAARQLQEEVQRATGLYLPIIKAFAPCQPTNVVLLACGPEQAAAFGLEPDVGNTLAGAPQAVAGQAYRLTLRRGRAELYASTEPGLFYAIQTLRQLVRVHGKALPALTIHDWPSLPYRGLLLDISRRKVPTVETLKHLVREMSHYKLNVLQLYTEHTFHFPRHPHIGAGCGSLTSEDILELDALCRQYCVELMPNLQSFGHARNTLLLPDYRRLAESDLLWTLSPAFEETYTLLDELYGDMLPSFTSPTLNVDCDETYDLGRGASKALVEEAGGGPDGMGRVYLGHIMRLRDLAARYGCRIQIWGDILLNHPDLIEKVPDDVTLLLWNYDPLDEYGTVWNFAEAGRCFWVCPGTGSWNSIFPRLSGARINIRNLVRDGVAAGAAGMLNTDWGDFGHYQPMGLSWHGYLFGAAQGWTGGITSDEEFDAAFGPLFLGPEQGAIMEVLDQLARTNDLPGVYQLNRSHSVLALFDEPLIGETVAGEDALPAETLAEMQALTEAACATLEEVMERVPEHPRRQTLREMAFAARLTAYAARKTALGQRIRHSLHELEGALAATPGDPPAPLEESAGQIDGYILALKGLEIKLEVMRFEFEALWLARARRSEIHVALGYYASLRARYRAAIAWLEAQRRALLAGEPVDAALSTYQAGDHRVLWQTWPD